MAAEAVVLGWQGGQAKLVGCDEEEVHVHA